MADQVSDFIFERLREWGIERVYGYPGDGINGIMGALARAGAPQFIQSRHEEMSAFMACGHAKFTGQLGVCLATSGPGAIHLLNGLYDAKLDHQPVLAICGQQPSTALGSSYMQEVDLHSLFKDVAHEYVQTVTNPHQLPAVIDRAVRTAICERTVTALIVPADLQDAKAVKETPHQFKMAPGSLGVIKPRILPPKDDALQRAAGIINSGERVAILVGQGARNAADEVIELADKTGAGVAKALLGKDVLPDDLSFVTGSIGLLGTKPSYELMMNCDTFVMIGSSFPYSQFLPEFGQARGIQIDIDPKMIGIRYPMELNLVGDSRETLQALLPMIEKKEDLQWRRQIEDSISQWWKIVEDRAMSSANPVNPQRVFWELSPRLPDNCIITADSGSGTNWFARDLKIRKGMRASVSGTLASMGCAVPYAIAAKFCYPERAVIALAGDGAMQMNGMNELLTIKKYAAEWSDPRLIVLVLHNNDLNQVTWEMRAMEGDPKYEASQNLPDINYAAYAELCCLKGIRIEKPEQIIDAWEAAFSADRPVVIDALCDPSVPPLPPHTSWEQTEAMLSSLLKGDPDAGDIIRQSFKGIMKGLIH